jgi:hypothetical protein
MSICVETEIRGSLDDVWRRTQDPLLHQRWDLRFTAIDYLPKRSGAPQQFCYSTRLGFGLEIQGEGETIAERRDNAGECASSLRFWSRDRKSLIREGAGYWKYVLTSSGVRFITAYDYRVRFGAAGRAFDRVVFRPMIAWATAWSFDRLRLWIEKGIDPAGAMAASLIHMIARLAVAFVWIYQGLIPKLVAQHVHEIEMLSNAGVSDGMAPALLTVIGCAEFVLGLATLLCLRSRWPFVATLVLMVPATILVATHSPLYLRAAFNPISLNLLMAAMALVGWLATRNLPSAANCKWKYEAR